MELDFGTAVLVVGAVLFVAAGLSSLMRGTVLSIEVLAVAAGVVLAVSGTATVEPGSPGVLELVELALLITLFSDGLIVE